MRELLEMELGRVGGGVGDIVYHDNRDQLKWGNNGFGNGADLQNIAPGHSGMRRGSKGRFAVGNGGGMHDSLGDDQGPR
ncbi:MAG TPA: hypothetical protein VN231_02100 [Allosphingosinicella sp.]|nr:hypothetical protein [Allosphingosinicella sp.]